MLGTVQVCTSASYMDPFSQESFASMLDLWCHYATGYVTGRIWPGSSDDVKIVRYEDILARPLDVLDALENMGLPRNFTQLAPINKSVTKNGVGRQDLISRERSFLPAQAAYTTAPPTNDDVKVAEAVRRAREEVGSFFASCPALLDMLGYHTCDETGDGNSLEMRDGATEHVSRNARRSFVVDASTSKRKRSTKATSKKHNTQRSWRFSIERLRYALAQRKAKLKGKRNKKASIAPERADPCDQDDVHAEAKERGNSDPTYQVIGCDLPARTTEATPSPTDWSASLCITALLRILLPEDNRFLEQESRAAGLATDLAAEAKDLLTHVCHDVFHRQLRDPSVVQLADMTSCFQKLFLVRRMSQPNDRAEMSPKETAKCWNDLFEDFAQTLPPSQLTRSKRDKRSIFQCYIRNRFGGKRFVSACWQTGTSWLPRSMDTQPKALVNALLLWCRTFRADE